MLLDQCDYIIITFEKSVKKNEWMGFVKNKEQWLENCSSLETVPQLYELSFRTYVMNLNALYLLKTRFLASLRSE